MIADQLLQLASEYHRGGQLRSAEDLYREILQVNPRHAGALHLMGVLCGQMGQWDEAERLIRAAIEEQPDMAAAMANLGNVLRARGLVEEPIHWYRKAIAKVPNFYEARSNLGNTLVAKGELDGGIACYREAIRIMPGFADGHLNLGLALRRKGEIDAAIEAIQKAISLRPNEAVAHRNLGQCLVDKRDYPAAIAAYRRALALDPKYAEAYAMLCLVLRQSGDLDGAIEAGRTAVALAPNQAMGYAALGYALKEAGRIEVAVAALHKAVELAPNDPQVGSQFILALHYHPDITAVAILGECQRWAHRHGERQSRLMLRHENDPAPDRRLRVGYVSPDFRQHPLALFIQPLLARHDRKAFEVFCYANVSVPDKTTAKLERFADHWRNIHSLTDDQAADLIRQDQIDILVDLSLHSSDNRLLIFAKRPAPVQLSYLGYCSTTGLGAMNYRLTDRFLDPPGGPSDVYTERSIVLADSYWCYQPGIAAPLPGPPPAQVTGHVTFGCLNNFSKVSVPTLETWCKILQSVPHSRLVLHAKPGEHQKHLLELMGQQGIDAERVRFVPPQSVTKYFETYQWIDIALDPFRFNGGATTFDALWMGVPVITLAGNLAVSRVGVSILNHAGLPQWVAQTREQYVQIACDLAKDLPQLAEVRQTLRKRLSTSALMDAVRFTQHIEEAYRQMWAMWCVEAGPALLSQRRGE